MGNWTVSCTCTSLLDGRFHRGPRTSTDTTPILSIRFDVRFTHHAKNAWGALIPRFGHKLLHFTDTYFVRITGLYYEEAGEIQEIRSAWILHGIHRTRLSRQSRVCSASTLRHSYSGTSGNYGRVKGFVA